MQVSPKHLIASHGLVSDQVDPGELEVVLSKLIRASSIPGSIVEFGCYSGTSSLYIRRVLDLLGNPAGFHVYDSFEGLPEKSREDQSPVGEQFKKGELFASKKALLRNFQKAGLRPPIIHKGWFDELTDADIPKPIAFAFLDGDYYESIRVSLHLIEQKLAPGAIIVIDDYANLALPGAARAADAWAKPRGLSVTTSHSLGIIRT